MMVTIELKEFNDLKVDVEVFTDYDGDYMFCKGNVSVNQEEFAETMSVELKHQINEFNNVFPEWNFEYKFTKDGFELETRNIAKIENDRVYFEVV